MYDLSGLNDPKHPCGPYVGVPDPDATIGEAMLNGVAPQGDYQFAIVDTITFDTATGNGTSSNPIFQKHHLALIDSFRVREWLKELKVLGNGKLLMRSELHYYPKRNPAQVALHKDTTGKTVFVILHYYTTETIYGPEYTFDTGTLMTIPDKPITTRAVH
jgi:hypothetical protein